LELKNIKKIGIVGAGTMGSGIASVSALRGFETVLYDVSTQALTKAHALILSGYDKLVDKGRIKKDGIHEIEKRLRFASEINLLSECDFIIEAAVENFDLKKIIYGQLDELTRPDVVLATNTSSLSVTAVSSSVKTNRSRVAGMHFFNPPNVMKLVEIIRGEYTSEDTINTVIDIAKKFGKTPVLCKDTPAFIVNRIARPFYGEALKQLSEGVLTVEVIDRIVREEGGFPMGPFELMDLIGIDVNYSVTKSVFEAFYYDPKYRPHPIQQKMVESGLLGRKTNRGFYSY
jgi:3-hydroxybutyryl-CoA dehydrogenase